MSARRGGALAVLLLVLALLTGCTEDAGDTRRAAATSLPAPLPAVALDSFDGGEPLDLSTLKGPALVNLWAQWCGPCREEMPILQEFSEKYAGRVDVVGIDFQDPQSQKARDLVEETGVTYPLYVDPDGDLDRAAPFPHLRGLPFLAFVDAEGQVVAQQFVEIRDLEHLEELVETHLGVA